LIAVRGGRPVRPAIPVCEYPRPACSTILARCAGAAGMFRDRAQACRRRLPVGGNPGGRCGSLAPPLRVPALISK
jgi:hypothetical protein